LIGTLASCAHLAPITKYCATRGAAPAAKGTPAMLEALKNVAHSPFTITDHSSAALVCIPSVSMRAS
jgi:hypothetical protein